MPPPSNGLRSFAFHAGRSQGAATALAAAVGGQAAGPAASLDAETAARMYLQQALASQHDAVRGFTAAPVDGRAADFKLLSAEKLPLTGTQAVKFRQYYRGIPVYGSLVTVELDAGQRLLAINSALAEPDVNPVAEFSVKQIVDIIRKEAGYPPDKPLDIVPQLQYYYAPEHQKWYLVYVAEDVPKYPAGNARQHALPEVNDYVICAHTGKPVAELPRTMTAAADNGGAVAAPLPPDVPNGWEVKTVTLTDGLGRNRKVTVITNGTVIRLYDPHLRVYTHDFRFRDIDLQANSLPGDLADNPPEWADGAISAHANAADIALFLREVLGRNGLDGLGGVYVSSVCCCSAFNGGLGKAWHNAAWIGTQMVYGQRQTGNGAQATFRSYALAADVVAHEIFHGVTTATARLHYQNMSGALNESYSDIFATLITNFSNVDRTTWNWEMGEDLEGTGIPIRDLSDPKRFGQPAHMDKYLDTIIDNGGVHTNSGIHNKAFHNLAVAPAAAGGLLVTNRELATLFYYALTQHLSRTSGFSDSRRAVDLVARSLFRDDPRLPAAVAAVAAAFDAVGIPAP